MSFSIKSSKMGARQGLAQTQIAAYDHVRRSAPPIDLVWLTWSWMFVHDIRESLRVNGLGEASGCWSADGRRHIQLGSLRDLDRSPPRGCRYHQDPSRTCTGCAVASGISFACPSSSMAIVSPCKREPEKETLKFEDSFPASFPFATKRSTFDETEGMTVGSPQADHRSQ